MGVRAEMLQRMPLVWSKSGLLLFSHPLRGDFRQLIRARLTDEDSNFVIGWLAAMLCGESLDCGVPLRAAHAVLFEQFIRDTANLESVILAFGIATRLYLAGAAGFESAYLEDLARLGTFEPAEQVAAAYVDAAPRIRVLLHPVIAAQPESRRAAIVAEIDRLGLLFDAL